MTRLLLLSCASILLLGGPLSAHSMFQSAVLLDFDGNAAKAELQLPVDRLAISFRKTVDQEHFAAERAELASYVTSHVHPVSADGRAFSVQLLSMSIKQVEKGTYLVVQVVFTPPPKATVDLFTLNYDVINHEIVTHVVLVSIRSDSRAKLPLGEPLLIGMLRGERKSLLIDRMRVL